MCNVFLYIYTQKLAIQQYSCNARETGTQSLNAIFVSPNPLLFPISFWERKLNEALNILELDKKRFLTLLSSEWDLPSVFAYAIVSAVGSDHYSIFKN